MARKKFACDFETTTDPADCRVWGYGIKEIGSDKPVIIGKDIESFMLWAMKSKSDLYFHNLKFDGSFIVNWLLRNGYRYSKEPLPNTFNVLISGMGAWYMIDICFGYQGKRKLHTGIYDSLKKLPYTIERIATAFKLELKKGSIDYDKYRPIGYEPDEEEKEYIVNDVEILAQALDIQFNQGLDKMTTGADALSDFKQTITHKRFKKLFPILPLQIDADIRKAYRGGFTHLQPQYAEKTLTGIVFDINSMYPAVMMNKRLPIGYPEIFYGEYEHDPEYPLFIQHIRCEFKIKDKHIPTIQIKKNPLFKSNEYLTSSDGEFVDLYVTNVDLALIKDHYELDDLEYLGGYKFRESNGIFDDYITKWNEVKMANTGALREMAKLMLNSLYGKFASNPDVTGKEPYLNEDLSNGFRVGDEEIKNPVYTAMGVFITSYARDQVIRTAQEVYDRFVYCDTDSLHLTGTEIPKQLKDYIHPTELGKWDLEGQFTRGKYLRQKTYIHEYTNDDGSIKKKVTCAGMPGSVKEKVTFENFRQGFSATGKLMPKQVPGGTVLVETEFSLK